MKIYSRTAGPTFIGWQIEWLCNGLTHRIGGEAKLLRSHGGQYVWPQFYLEGKHYSESDYKSALKERS